MSYLRTRSGDIWGSAAQMAAVRKAAKISADKRRKRHGIESHLRTMHTADAQRLLTKAKTPVPPAPPKAARSKTTTPKFLAKYGGVDPLDKVAVDSRVQLGTKSGVIIERGAAYATVRWDDGTEQGLSRSQFAGEVKVLDAKKPPMTARYEETAMGKQLLARIRELEQSADPDAVDRIARLHKAIELANMKRQTPPALSPAELAKAMQEKRFIYHRGKGIAKDSTGKWKRVT